MVFEQGTAALGDIYRVPVGENTATASEAEKLIASSQWDMSLVGDLIDDDGDVFPVLDALVREVGVFTDWPATVTWYAHRVDRRSRSDHR
jgi:hypothetical protein